MLGFGYSQITFGRVGGINKAMNLDSLRERLAAVPERPGVYLLRDAKGQVIYVGKAAGLMPLRSGKASLRRGRRVK